MHSIPEITPISELRHRQNELLAKLSEEPVILTQRGKGIAVLVGLDTWNRIMERLEDLEDALDAQEARLDAEPIVDFDEYVKQRGKRVSAAVK